MTWSLTDGSFVADPYPQLAEMRAAGSMLVHEESGRWLATTHESVTQTLRNRRLGRLWLDREPARELEPFNALHRNQMMENEPPAHTRLRPRVEVLAAELLEQMSGTVDILGSYAEPLPVLVIADLLGVPGQDHVMLREWSQAIVQMYEQDVDDEVTARAIDASSEFSAYVAEVVAERRRVPGDDLISDLVRARDDGGPLSDDELVASVVLLLNAGHEASVNVFGNGIHALLSHPGELARVTSGDVPVATALEEMIRYDAPLQMFERTATADVEIAGTSVAAGSTVACLMGSANRDFAAFDRPDVFDVSRDPNPHVGFGMGVHFCLGAPLARMELEISLRQLLDKHPSLTLTGDAPRRPTWVLRGFERIDVTLEGS